MKLALVTEIPAPFRIPLFNALAQRVELRVFFLHWRDPRRPHYGVHEGEVQFDHELVWPLAETRRGSRWFVLSAGTRTKLRRFGPDVVLVGGWNQPAMWSARTLRRPTLVWVESTLRDERPGRGALEWAKRRFVASAAGFVVPGTASAEYVRSLGVPDAKIHVAPNAIDTALFSVERRPHDGCVFLYVGRLDREKGVDVLLRAFEGVAGELRIVGSGSENGRLRELAGEHVRFLGKVGRDDLPRIYAGADVLVLPSLSEPWGMVLNEGATAGLALVASDAAGAALDLIEDGANGFRVPAGDSDALHAALRRLADDETLRRRFGERSRELAQRFTPDAWADAVADAARRVS